MRAKGMGKARHFGLAKVAMQVAMAIMVANLGLAAVCRDLERVVAWISANNGSRDRVTRIPHATPAPV